MSLGPDTILEPGNVALTTTTKKDKNSTPPEAHILVVISGMKNKYKLYQIFEDITL